MILGLAAGWLAAAAAGPVEARPFEVIRPRPDARTVIDPAAIEQVGEGVRRTWVVTVQRSILGGDPPQPGYVRTLTEFDCARQTTRWRSLQAYSATGDRLLSEDNRSSDWLPAADRGETLVSYRIVCEGGTGDSVISADTIGQVVVALIRSFDPMPPAQPKPPPPAPRRR